MTEVMWVRSHVRVLLQDAWDVCHVHVDGDGSVLYRSGSAACRVSVLDSDPIMVRVSAHAVTDIKASAKLLRELNDIQHRARSARVGHHHGVVEVSQVITAAGLDAPALVQATSAVGELAAEIGPLLAPMFGGTTPFTASVDAEPDAPEGPF